MGPIEFPVVAFEGIKVEIGFSDYEIPDVTLRTFLAHERSRNIGKICRPRLRSL
jgi:hypothetical protein